jgi:sulfopyruvate decarboxylase subunit alpha
VATRNAYSDAVVDGLGDWGIETFAYVPSSHVAPIITTLLQRGVEGILCNREDEASAVAGGLALAGRRVALIIQDNGFGNALTVLTTFVKAYHVSVPIFANTRGGPGEYNAMIHAFSDAVPELLRAAGIRVERVGAGQSPAVWRRCASSVCELAGTTHRPVALLMDVMHPVIEENVEP